MATREHRKGRTRITVRTLHTDIVGSFIEWGGEAWRERKYTIAAVWWNPLTWNKHEWRREGAPPITAVQFFRGDGVQITDAVLNPALTTDTGYVKVSCVYTFVSTGIGAGPSALGNDARSVANVKITYSWDGSTRILPDH